jgi:uracil-DNA glycosylase family 4
VSTGQTSNVSLPDNQLLTLMEGVKNYLGFLSETGITGFDCSEKSLNIAESWGKKKAIYKETLENIRTDMGQCRRCLLCSHRENIVFGSGNPNARLVFVGEGPGYDEDIKAEPFVGAAGMLLTKIIEAMQFSRDHVYICNIVKCRPPDNRNPDKDEIKACLPFLKRQIEAIGPKFICALGSVAAQTILGSTRPISKLRGTFYDVKGIQVMPTYHPAYLLRNPDKKRDVWEDMKKLLSAYNSS